MRILYVLTTLAVGGAERQVVALATRMAGRGHAVVLMTLKPGAPDDCATELDVVHLGMGQGGIGLGAGLQRALKFARAFHPDIVHSHNFHGNIFARLLRLCYRPARLVSTIHNVYEGGPLRMFAYRITNGLADRTTAVSSAVAARFVRLKAVSQEKCVVITNGIDADEFLPDAERRAAMRAQMGVADEFVWLSVGRGAAAKDRENLFQAFGNVCGVCDNAQLWIAGEAPGGPTKSSAFLVGMPQSAREKIRPLGLRKDIPALLDASDGFVLASAWEGMPLAVGEAMAMLKPVVATDVGGVRELVGPAGVLVPAKDASALCGAMLKLMQCSGEQRSTMGQAARARILESFDIANKADEWEALYLSVFRQSSSR
jgi:glycosyltransferase involved in cell wall biosynthesis